MSRSDKSLPNSLTPARRKIPLSVFSLRPNTHTAHPPIDIVNAPASEARSGLRRWAIAAFGICAAGAGLFLWKAAGTPKTSDSAFTHIESTATGRAQTKVNDYGSALKWRNREVVIAIDDSIDELGPRAREAVQSAFGSWLETGAELPRLRFESTHGKKPSERPDGINTVMFAPIDLAGHKNDVAITLTFSDPKTGEIVEADIVINSSHPFAVLGAPAQDKTPQADSNDDTEGDSDNDDRKNDESVNDQRRAEGASARSCGPATTTGAECGKAYDLENAAAHEVGHFFGLGEDVEDTKTSMYQCISRCEVQKRTLESGDRTAAVELYVGSAAAAEEANAAGCGGARIASSPSGRGTLLPFAAIVVAGLVARRRRA